MGFSVERKLLTARAPKFRTSELLLGQLRLAKASICPFEFEIPTEISDREKSSQPIRRCLIVKSVNICGHRNELLCQRHCYLNKSGC